MKKLARSSKRSDERSESNAYIEKRIGIISDFGLELPDEIKNRILSAESEVDADRIITQFILDNVGKDDDVDYIECVLCRGTRMRNLYQ